MKKLKALVPAFFIGVGIGAMIEALISIFVGVPIVGVPTFVQGHDPAFVKLIQSVLYGGFGIVGVLGSQVSTKGSLFKKTTIHLVVLLIYYSFAGLYLRWISLGVDYIINIIIFILIYFIIWTSIYFSEKKKIRAMNEKIKKMKQ